MQDTMNIEKDRKERERIEGIQEKINNIRDLGIMLVGVNSITIEERLIIMKDMQISDTTYMEFMAQAIACRERAIETLEKTLTERLQFEKEEAQTKEKARQEALRPDREKLIKFADSLYNIPIPEVKSAEAQQILSDASDVLDELSMNMKVQAKEL